LVSSQQLVCSAPAFTKPDNAAYPLEVMFSLNFGDDDYSKIYRNNSLSSLNRNMGMARTSLYLL